MYLVDLVPLKFCGTGAGYLMAAVSSQGVYVYVCAVNLPSPSLSSQLEKARNKRQHIAEELLKTEAT